MIDKVRRYCEANNLIASGDNIIVGVSGGADSVCLLCVLVEVFSAQQIVAVHINHGIRETAGRDEAFVKALCKDKGVAYKGYSFNAKELAKSQGISTEEAGRRFRYEAFSMAAKELGLQDYKIAVAHNMDDNAETMLLNIFRGTGIRGVAGIPERRGNIVRPLLCVKRSEIEAYLKSINQSFCTDETNLSDDYTRNKIRHHILPIAIEGINERAIDKMSDLSDNVSLLNDYLDKQVDAAIADVARAEGDAYVIEHEGFEMLHAYIKKALILEILGRVSGTKKDISNVHIDDVVGLFKLQVGKRIDLPYDMEAVRCYEGVRIATKQAKNQSCGEVVSLALQGITSYEDMKIESFIQDSWDEILVKKYTKWIDYDKISHGLTVRHRQEGDYITINEQGGTKKLKSYFVDEKIPQSERDRIILIADGSHIVWVVGYRISAEYKVTNETKKILCIECVNNRGELS